MAYLEDDLLPISALQHLLFCERQCALIHVERQWEENRLTAEGQVLHKKAHEGSPETRAGERITRGLPLRSHEYGLVGFADIILWRAPQEVLDRQQKLPQAILQASPEELANWEITPVEYKRGKPKKDGCDRVQLCAQALCLEEMLGITIAQGQLFYGTTRRRHDVFFDQPLRKQTKQAAVRFREIVTDQELPKAAREKKCDSCSLYSACQPPLKSHQLASEYLKEIR